MLGSVYATLLHLMMIMVIWKSGMWNRWRDAAGRWRRAPGSALAQACAVSFVLAGSLQLTPAALAAEVVGWIESYDEALEEARQTGKPIFLEFRCAP